MFPFHLPNFQRLGGDTIVTSFWLISKVRYCCLVCQNQSVNEKNLLSFRYFNHLVESNWHLIIYPPDVITVQITPGHRASWNVTTCLLWCFVQTCLLKCLHTRIVPVDGSSLNQQPLAWTIDCIV